MKQLFDATTGVLERAINLRCKRNSVLAGNIANVDTPGYRPRDMKFKKLMDSYMRKPAAPCLEATDPAHIVRGNSDSTPLIATDSRHFQATGLDDENSIVEISTEQGTPNSLDLDQEMAKLSANNLQYQAAVSVLIKKFQGLMTAITEGGTK